jgi:hypothetical protein
LRLETDDFSEAMQEAEDHGWMIIVEDYGFCDVHGDELLDFEHFCSDDCLDPPEWDDDE